jgi:membrane-associated phospholipid phosphatase
MKFMALFALAASLSSLQAQNFGQTQPANRKAIKTLIAPAALIAAGLISFDWKYAIRQERNEDFPHFKTHADDYLQYAPAVAVYGLNWAGIHGKNDLANQTALLLKSELVMIALVQSLKYSTHVVRPDGSDQRSFVSGHTAQAFAAATFFQKEYGHVSVWYTIGGYTAATAVGALRILNNKHWLPDVLAGAGIGILSTNLVYLTHQYRWGKKKKTHALIYPTYSRGPGFYFCLRLN